MSFAHYLLQVNLYLIVFYAFYKFLLDKETYFMLNRIYLVSAGLLSLCIPFIRLEWLTEQKATQQVYATVNWEMVLEKATLVKQNDTDFSWANALVFVYCLGIAFFLFKLIYNLFMVKKLLHNAKTGSAFSFFSSKVVDEELPQKNVIDIHEEAHIKQWHTLDILFFEVIGIITWINPIIYFYKKSIKNIHEFLADELASEYQGDKAEYALLLLSKSFGISPNVLTNGFLEKSLIKKRIFMLHKERSKKAAILKYGFFIPLFAILIVFSSATVRKNEKLISFSEQIPLEAPLEMVSEIVDKPALTITENPIIKADTSINYETGSYKNLAGIYKHISTTVKYPSEAAENDIQGFNQLTFNIKEGEIRNINITANLGYGCEEAVIKSLKSFKNYEKLIDGKYALRTYFKLAGSKAEIKNKETPKVLGAQNFNLAILAQAKTLLSSTDEDKNVYDFVSIDKQPNFEGDQTNSKFSKYLSAAIKYPEEAQANNVQGKVFLSFVVEKNGDLTDIQITRGLGSGCDEEAIRVLKACPKWNPGLQNGVPVRVKFNINVNFSLASGNPVNERVTGIRIRNNNSLERLETVYTPNQPLIIKDGIIQEGKEALKYTNPNTIESISVLKDEKAIALYGSKGKNGVILITTKPLKEYVFRKPM